MWTHNQNSKEYIRAALCALVVITFIGTVIYAAENEEEPNVFEKYMGDINKEFNRRTNRKKVDKTPQKFIPTEVVSADQAVAFPTDI